ncbi:MAG: TlpA family protein disulfide reductase [Thermoleophilaceae bacterium]|nr:TlpA family protein disulfide reductase [Thermoleophilaceae bacterium]
MRWLVALAMVAAAVAGCGEDAPPAGGGPSPPSAAADAPRNLPPALDGVQRDANQLLDGGADAFERRLAELEGHPVVVNKWASWCAPCRAEFPFFQAQAQERAGEVAFIGVNSGDNDADAASFLEEYPVPYPSYKDPELEVADVFNGVAAFPTTAFYDERGELVYVKQGGYASEELLAEDIERYAG